MTPMPDAAEAGSGFSTQVRDEEFTRTDREAMRAYLQRTEVRLSTLHRIATSFIGGAGLLILLPVFFKDQIVVVINVFLAHAADPFPTLGGLSDELRMVLFLSLFYPFVLSLSIPLYSLYMMLKDVIHFYFTIYTPGFSPGLITPSFALGGIAFSPDESPLVKAKILEYQYQTESVNFAIPFSKEKREVYFDQTIECTDGDIIPSTRRWEMLVASGAIPADADRQTIERFNAALGLARTLDRRLVEEVATSEVSLVRHVLYLRRLVLRYVKTLLMFIWTTLVSFAMIPFLQDGRLPTFLLLALGYLVWALLALPIMRVPLGWIYRHLKGIPDESQIDHQLTVLESQVSIFVKLAAASAAFALLVSLWVYFTR